MDGKVSLIVMNRKKELIKNTLILMLGQISGQAISFLMLPIYTTYLKPKDYGLVDLISILSSVLAPTLLFQLNMGSFRFLIDARNDREKQKNIISSVMIAILLLLLIYMPLGITVGFAFSIEYINLILASIFSSMVYILFLQFARGLGKNNLFSVACLIDGVVLVISNILFIVTLKMGAQGMILSSVISNIIATLYLIVATDINNLFCKKSIKKNTVKEIVKYSLPLVPNGISWWAVGTIDKLLVSFFLGLYKNGIYAIANKFAIIFNCIYYVFSLAWVESSSLHIKDTDNQKYISNVINESFRFFGLLSLIIISFCKLAFMIMINKQYNQSLLYV
jgi:O-antigen/teichoic acid export membrane protein